MGALWGMLMKDKTKLKLALSVTKDDCEWQYFRAGGKGGQHQNKTSSGVRVIHHPSGSRGESREERSQLQNRKQAWRRMVESASFKIWVNRRLYELDKVPEPELRESDVRTEIQVDGKWVEQP